MKLLSSLQSHPIVSGTTAVVIAAASFAGAASALNTPSNTDNQTQQPTGQTQQPVYRCELLTINHIASDSYKFSVKYAAYNGATYKSTVYRVYDANGKEVYNTANGKFNGFAAGNYTVKAFITVSVNGKDETVTSDGCTKTFTIKSSQNDQDKPKPDKPSEPTPKPQEPSKPVEPSKPTEPSKPSNPSKPTEPSKPSNPSKPAEPKPSTPSQPSNPEPSKPATPAQPLKPASPSSSSKNSTPSNTSTPANPAPATPSASSTATATNSSASNNTSSTNTTPSELPKTGISSALGLIGTGSLGYAAYAYTVSRRQR